MDKITIERETLERAITALTYHQNQTRPIESTRITLETLRALLAAQPPTVDGHLKCGHHQSLAINSAETGEFLYCDLCDAKSRCRDAEAMEAELRAALAAQPAERVLEGRADALARALESVKLGSNRRTSLNDIGVKAHEMARAVREQYLTPTPPKDE